MKPIIGITTYIRKGSFRSYSQVGYEYIDKIEKSGGIPLEIPILQDFTIETLNHLMDSFDGIIFSGGANIDSLWYGEEPLEKLSIETELRNNFERALFSVAKKKKVPILGICRGSQLINVLQGGSLFQNIDIQMDTEIDHEGVDKKIEEKQHVVYLEKDSFLTKISNKSKISVNSFHVQCIKKLGENLRVTAKSEDGIAEAIEYEGGFFMHGVQWHPEGLEDQLPLFKEFVNVCSINK
ncbi:gamma-glutamyl-gamma-aminobutyrate hydrolase [Clostridium gelidum]|uniref:Gamma-glutamyl-gamma-aminobutyrate hydrolase n=1 Tax=Clostridium gelidum TaxID=704125 RepID=A0ABN6J1C6_9CLOT|nr:gamma-glutamyl-gamma-aminobutyrate hydrolase family protein [Clostridium gelidum]BCZ46547.1 gamma-glutamyl-gamma-aminobutyrate hydrolase [Clostridium gelidum]